MDHASSSSFLIIYFLYFIDPFFFLHFAELPMEAVATATVLTPPAAPPRPSVFLGRPSALAFSTKVFNQLFLFYLNFWIMISGS